MWKRARIDKNQVELSCQGNLSDLNFFLIQLFSSNILQSGHPISPRYCLIFCPSSAKILRHKRRPNDGNMSTQQIATLLGNLKDYPNSSIFKYNLKQSKRTIMNINIGKGGNVTGTT